MRGAWIEITLANIKNMPPASLPVRGAWIEIQYHNTVIDTLDVAPCEGSVD